MLGHFANRDGWYGRADFTEYVQVLADPGTGRLLAVKARVHRWEMESGWVGRQVGSGTVTRASLTPAS